MGHRLEFLSTCPPIFLARYFLRLPAWFQGSFTGVVSDPSGSQVPDALSGPPRILSQCIPQDRHQHGSGRPDNDGAQFGGQPGRVFKSVTNQLRLCIFQGEARQ